MPIWLPALIFDFPLRRMVRKNVRDIYGRFPGKESLPYRAGFIDRPLVDEYGRLLRRQLREMGVEVPEPPKQIKKYILRTMLTRLPILEMCEV